MPVQIKSLNGKYSVHTPGGTKSYGTTKKKAERQARLLRAIDHGWKPKQEAIKSEAEALVGHLIDGLERGFVEPTKLSGGKYGKGVDPKGKTGGKFKFPRNFKVGHAIKS
jgi:hypothetical protein